MEALHDVVRAGKARYIGASSMYAWQFAKAQAVRADGWTVRLDAEPLQPDLPRGGAGDDPAVPRPGRRRAAVEPARARAPGRQPHARGRAPDDARADRPVRRLALRRPSVDFAVVDRAAEVAAERGVPTAQVALAWLLHKPGVTAPIVGATKLEHLEDALAAEELELSDDEIARLEEPYVPHAVSGH